MTCTVTGTLRAADTSLLPNTLITFIPDAVEKQSGGTVVPDTVGVTTDDNAEFSVDLYPSKYVVAFRTKQDTFRARVLVPVGLGSADLKDLIDLSDMDDDSVFTVRWGSSASPTLDSSGVVGLSDTSVQFGTVDIDSIVAASGEYVYAVFPASFTEPDIFKLFGFEEAPVVSSVDVYQDGIATEHTVWRSPYTLTGSVPLLVSTTSNP